MADPAAITLLTPLLLNEGSAVDIHELEWESLTFVQKATGRLPLTDAESARLRERDIRWLVLS